MHCSSCLYSFPTPEVLGPLFLDHGVHELVQELLVKT